MFSLIILALYGLIVLMYVIIALFVIYHLVKYSLNSELKIIMLVFFIAVSAGLLLSNLVLFFSINWNSLISQIIF